MSNFYKNNSNRILAFICILITQILFVSLIEEPEGSVNSMAILIGIVYGFVYFLAWILIPSNKKEIIPK